MNVFTDLRMHAVEYVASETLDFIPMIALDLTPWAVMGVAGIRWSLRTDPCRAFVRAGRSTRILEPSWCLALELLRFDSPVERAESILAALADPALQEGVHDFALRHGVLGAVLKGLERLIDEGGGTGPGSSLARLLTPLSTVKRQTMLWEFEVDRILVGLDRAGLAPVLLKGAALRRTAYREAVERSLGDLDLLVFPEEVESAVALLESLGYAQGEEHEVQTYREHHFHYRLRSRAGFQVEVHWGLLPPDAPQRLPASGFVERARLIERAGTLPLLVPSPEDMLLHLASQQIEDAVTTLRRSVDMDRVLRSEPDLDWEALWARAREHGLLPALALSLQLTACLLGSPIPPTSLGGHTLSPRNRHQLALLDPVFSLLDQWPRRRAAAAQFIELWLAPTTPDRWRHLRRMLSGQPGLALSNQDTRRGPIARAAAVAKFLGFASWLNVRGLVRSLLGAPSPPDQFWYH